MVYALTDQEDTLAVSGTTYDCIHVQVCLHIIHCMYGAAVLALLHAQRGHPGGLKPGPSLAVQTLGQYRNCGLGAQACDVDVDVVQVLVCGCPAGVWHIPCG